VTVQGHPRIRFERNRFAGSPFPAQAAVGEIQAMLLDEALGTDDRSSLREPAQAPRVSPCGAAAALLPWAAAAAAAGG